jgi:hypothetical protein
MVRAYWNGNSLTNIVKIKLNNIGRFEIIQKDKGVIVLAEAVYRDL